MSKVNKYFLNILVLVFFVLIGFLICRYIEKRTILDFKQSKEDIANITLAAINPERVDRLSKIIPGDISSSDDWVRLKEQSVLMGSVFAQKGIDAVYILAKKDESFYFLTESTPEGNPLYVPAGALYREPPKELSVVFESGKAKYTELYTDEYGTYTSYFSPILNKANNLVGVLGVDIDQNYYISKLNYNRLIFWSFWLFLYSFFYILFLYFKKSYNLKNESLASEQKVTGIINSINDGIVVVDSDLKIVFWNQASEDIFGYNFEQVLGTKLCDLGLIKKVTNIKTGEVIKDFHLSFDQELVNSVFELELKNQKNKYYEASFDVTEVINNQHLVLVLHDISRRKKEQEDLELKTDELEKLNNLMVGRELKMIELKKKISQK